MTPLLEQKETRACERSSGHSVSVPDARLDIRAPPFGVSSRRPISRSGCTKKVSLSRLLKIPVFLLGGGFFMALCHDLPAQDDASEDAGVETS